MSECAVKCVYTHLTRNMKKWVLGTIFQLHCDQQKSDHVIRTELVFCRILVTIALFWDICNLLVWSKPIYFYQRKLLVLVLPKFLFVILIRGEANYQFWWIGKWPVDLDARFGVEADHVEKDQTQQFHLAFLEVLTEVFINTKLAWRFLSCIEPQNQALGGPLAIDWVFLCANAQVFPMVCGQ